MLILGRGFMGTRLQEAFGCPVNGDKIYKYSDARAILEKHRPKIVLNCIGYAGENNVDDCEKDPDKTLQANTVVPVLVAEAAQRLNIKLVHISSGCIFHYDYDRMPVITEAEDPDFFELFYSRTKIYAEKVLLKMAERYNILILRIRIPLDDRPHPKNILNKLLRYKKVIDLPNSVTYIPDFIATLKRLIENDARGLYNVINKEGLRYPDLMDVYKKYVPEFKYEVIDHRNLNLVRTNLVLSPDRLEKEGIPVRPINEVLNECVKSYLNS